MLQKLAKRFDTLLSEPQYGIGKQMENVLLLIANIYNFKVCQVLFKSNIYNCKLSTVVISLVAVNKIKKYKTFKTDFNENYYFLDVFQDF